MGIHICTDENDSMPKPLQEPSSLLGMGGWERFACLGNGVNMTMQISLSEKISQANRAGIHQKVHFFT